jgi:hypothetical protein
MSQRSSYYTAAENAVNELGGSNTGLSAQECLDEITEIGSLCDMLADGLRDDIRREERQAKE